MATEITFVGIGAIGATDGATAPAPTLPSGLTDNDIMVCAFYSRETVDGTVSISSGWTPIVNHRDSGGLLAMWRRAYQPGDVAPTLTLGNHVANDTAIAQIAAWRGVNPTDPVDVIGAISTNTASVDIGPIAGISIDRRALLVVLGGKLDDWTSVNTITPSSTDADGEFSYQELGEPDSTLGLDAGMVWNYAINPGMEVAIPARTIDVVGGLSVAGKGIMVSFKLDADAFVADNNLNLYCAIAHPLTDSGIPGGVADLSMRATFTDIAADDDIEVVSDDAADTSIAMTIRGLDSSGNSVIQTATLNGTTPVVFSVLGVIERIEEVALSVPAVGNVTVRRSPVGSTIGVIPIGERGFRRIFRNAYSHPEQAKNYYEKIFIANTHIYYTVANVNITESADPTGFLTFAMAASQQDEAYSPSRLDAPADVDLISPTFDGSQKYIAGSGSNLDPGMAAGIWLKMSVPLNQAVFKNTYTLAIAGEVPA